MPRAAAAPAPPLHLRTPSGPVFTSASFSSCSGSFLPTDSMAPEDQGGMGLPAGEGPGTRPRGHCSISPGLAPRTRQGLRHGGQQARVLGGTAFPNAALQVPQPPQDPVTLWPAGFRSSHHLCKT